MSQIKWQDFLNILTLQGKDRGILKLIKCTSEDKVKFVTCYEANKAYLEEWLTEHTKNEPKSAAKSTELRLSGNKVYQLRRDKEALDTYNQSVIAAPFNSNQFALALANRSAVLTRLGYSEEAVQDIDLALEHGDDEIPRSKLLARKAVLFSKLKMFEECLQLIKSLYPNEEQISTQENADLKNAYENALRESKKKNSSNVGGNTRGDRSLPIPKGGENNKFPCASAYVSLKFSKDKGRHVVARKDLDQADVIFVEKPFALVVLPDQYRQHCHHCCKKTVSFIPCEVCTKALFCSVECQTTAWSLYHQWECRGLDVCHSIGIAHLGLRVALLADASDRYKQVSELNTHLDVMTEVDIYQYATTAALLTVYLEQYTSYFQSNNSTNKEKMGCQILRHIAQLICNGHAITKIDSTSLENNCSKTVSETQQRIATAIYPSASMMNHSCDQNISNSFINEHLIVRAGKPIKKGEEVFNCYGPHHTRMSRDERQTTLQKQYFFTCDCSKCSKPVESEGQQFSALLCSYCAGPVMRDRAACADCVRTQPLFELVNMALTAQEAYHSGQKIMNEGRMNDALVFLEESVKLSRKCLYKYNTDLRTYKDLLARVYTELEMYDEAIGLIEECILSVEKQFGCNSLELSSELMKLFDVLRMDLAKLLGLGMTTSRNYKGKLAKLKTTQMKVKKIIEGNMDASYLHSIPGMTAALDSVKLS
uniref:Protein-lysine N-methyltransferase SMYD4 n=1 Tax=Graphocephala atropunctata TaxID=36148 RepID=A0A1B6MLQ4_9HEMI